MDFPGEDNIPLLYHDYDGHGDDGYDDCKTPNTSKTDETSFTVPRSTEKETTSTLRLKQKLKRDKLVASYSHSNEPGNLDLINLDRFKLAADPKKRATVSEFYNGDK